MFKRIIPLALVASMLPVSFVASAVVSGITVHYTDGTPDATTAIASVDKIEFADGGVRLVLTDGTSTVMPYSTIESIDLNADVSSTGIKSIVGSVISAQVSGGYVRVVDAPANVQVDIYDIAGRKSVSAMTDANGTADVSVESLANGIYLLKVAEFNLKFIKR